MAGLYSFGKKEKLKSRKRIKEIFDDGRTFKKYPIIFFYQIRTQSSKDFPFKTGVSCSKRKFRRAVDRNRVKRLLREAYRLEKATIFDDASNAYMLTCHIDCMMIYTGKDLPNLQQLRKSVNRFLQYLSNRYSSDK